MEKTFLIKNRFKRNIGKLIISKNKFQLEISPKKEKKILRSILNRAFKKGISSLGEVILKDPIKPGNPLFFSEIRNQLARGGYILKCKK